MTASTTQSGEFVDVERLYRSHAHRLELIVRHDLHEVPQVVVEDACQFAWSRLVFHAPRIRRDTALSWLARTAVHEGFKLIRRQARELPLQDYDENEKRDELPPPSAVDPHELVEARARLGLTAQIPGRQARIVWLHALGFSYQEISEHSDCTPRTVERQLLRGRSSLRTLSAA